MRKQEQVNNVNGSVVMLLSEIIIDRGPVIITASWRRNENKNITSFPLNYTLFV